MHVATLAASSVALVLVVLIDQVTKAVAAQAFSATPRSALGVRLEVVRNPRASVGVINTSSAMKVAVAALATIAGLALIALASPLTMLSGMGLAVAIGGGVSNIADMLIRGHVVDFISIGQWPTFNLADDALSAVIAMAAIGLV
jgi:signal peptidase II